MSEITNPLGRLAQRPRMLVYLIGAFDEAWAAFRRDLASVPLQLWNEAAFRHLYVKSLRTLNPSLRMQTEWEKFDLLVQTPLEGKMPQESALIEFKFYLIKWHDELDGARRSAPKGYPSPGNYQNFLNCLRKLENHPVPTIAEGSVSRLLFLIYCDCPEWKSKTYGNYYDQASVSDNVLQREHLQEIHSVPSLTCPQGGDVINARLFLLTHDPLGIDEMFQLDRTAISFSSLEAQGDDRDTWFRRTPRERMAAIEYLRQLNYGQPAPDGGLQRILKPVEW